MQDVLTAIREKCTIEQAGFRLAKNAERHLKAPREMGHLFKGFEEATARTMEVVAQGTFSLNELRYECPEEPVPPGRSAQQHLEDLAWTGARTKFPRGVPDKVARDLAREFALIRELNYAPYFLTVHDIVAYARSQDILCQGRGSAANSVVCFCLGITAVDPTEIDLLFERFISAERKEPPDIDIDFEHERREEVIQYIYERYGRERAGLAATIVTYRTRSAVREVGKVMGLGADVTGALAGTVWGSGGDPLPEKRLREAGLDPGDPLLHCVIALTEELIGFPRHLSQHVGGFVLTRGPLCETVPIGNAAMEDRTFIEWDKDDLDDLGILKVDVLGLGMLTAIRKAFELIEKHSGKRFTLAGIPREDDAVYEMLSRADSIGVFQVESRAQMSMLPRLKPRTFYDLVIEVAIVRPGPIQGDMVHPYLRRRSGEEAVDIPSPAPEHGAADELERVLGKTLGVPLFQEQAMRLAMVAAAFTPGELNDLRRAMATFRRRGCIETLEAKMVSRMVGRGYERDFALRCFRQIEGFGEYGFPESHAASFALLAYVSAWLKCHHPAAFACALLDAQPMGFYAPAQIVRDARDHGVEVRPVDVHASEWDNTLERSHGDGRGPSPAPLRVAASPRRGEGWGEGAGTRTDVGIRPTPNPSPQGGGELALRLGLRQIEGLSEARAEALVRAHKNESYADMEDLRRRSGLPLAALEKLAAADAFRSLELDRREALWAVRGLVKAPPLPLFDHASAREQGAEPPAALPVMALPEHVVADYRTLRLSLEAHPMALLRPHFEAEGGAITAEALRGSRDGTHVAVAGLVRVRQRPGTAKGVVFMTLEDETGVVDIVVWRRTFEAHRPIVMGSRLILVRGPIQSQHGVVHVIADRVEDHTSKLHLLSESGAEAATGPSLTLIEDVATPERPAPSPRRHPRKVRIIPKSRDFH